MSEQANAVELATELTMAWLGNPNTRASPDDVPAFLRSMHGAVEQLTAPEAPREEEAVQSHTPAVSVRKSLGSKDHIISMIDGKPYRTLRRHLSVNGLTPDQYRERYGLKADYPMVAPNYSESRRAMAKKIGLGRSRKAAPEPAPAPAVAPPSGKPKRARKKAAGGSA